LPLSYFLLVKNLLRAFLFGAATFKP
jgi:hypothetical protein